MKWDKYKPPELYSTRNRAGFLLFPKLAFLPGHGYQWRWLEYAEWTDEYRSGGVNWQPKEWRSPR